MHSFDWEVITGDTNNQTVLPRGECIGGAMHAKVSLMWQEKAHKKAKNLLSKFILDEEKHHLRSCGIELGLSFSCFKMTTPQ